MKRSSVLLAALLLASCDIRLNMADEPTPTSPTGPTITNTNNNANTNNNDRSDTAAPPAGSGTGTGETAGTLPLPAYGEGVTRNVAATNPALLANSCQETAGEMAWRFLDLVVQTLRARDPRWGYLCKDATCHAIARDVVAYRASTDVTGIWIVDVIGNHCPGPTDSPPAVRWGVLPFETNRPWTAAR
jgi:hypothetical protein